MISVERSWSLRQRIKSNVLHIILLLLNAQALSPSSNDSTYRLISAAENRSVADINEMIESFALASFQHRRTGIIYDVTLPSSLVGLTVQVARLRSGSLRRRGFTFNEFIIPSGAAVDAPSPRWLAMVYRDFGGLEIYTPQGYTLVAPVLGIKVYRFSFNSSVAETLPELNLVAGSARISVSVPYLSLDQETPPYCAAFDEEGRVTISNVSLAPNICSSTHLGDFSLVLPSTLSSPAPQPSSEAPAYPMSFPNATSLTNNNSPSKNRRKSLKLWQMILALAVGATVLSLVLSTMVIAGLKYAKSSKIARMERRADLGEVFETAIIGKTRAPAAGSIRTRPTIMIKHDDSES